MRAAVSTLLVLTVHVVAGSAVADVLRVPQNHATIQGALTAAQEGDVVLVQPGTYAAPVAVPKGVELRSAGDDDAGELGLKRAERTIIQGASEGEASGVALAAGAVLDGFTITGVGRYDDELWNEHHATQGQEQPHEHIGRFSRPAVSIDNVDCTVRHNIVHHNGDTGIAVRGRDARPRIAHNICYRNMGGGIGSMKQSGALIAENRCFENFYAGIGQDGASPTIVNNVCYGNVRAGIGVSHGSSPLVRGNRCYKNRRAGIGVRTGAETSPVIEDNECYENAMAGVGCETEATPIIRRNRCHHNTLAGIGCRDGAAPLIVENECFENELAGIGCRDGARAVIRDNRSHHNQTAGIGVRQGADALISGNHCLENRLVAIGVREGATATIQYNKLARTGGMPPLVAVLERSAAQISENQLAGGGVAAVLVRGSVHISDNRFRGKGAGQGTAVWVWAGADATLAENRFRGYGTALKASGARVVAHDNTVYDFKTTAIRIDKPSQPAAIFDNTIHAAGEGADRAIVIDGDADGVVRNTILDPADRENE